MGCLSSVSFRMNVCPVTCVQWCSEICLSLPFTVVAKRLYHRDLTQACAMQPPCQPRAYSEARQQRVFRQWYPQFLFPPCASTDPNLWSISVAPKTFPQESRIFSAKKQVRLYSSSVVRGNVEDDVCSVCKPSPSWPVASYLDCYWNETE